MEEKNQSKIIRKIENFLKKILGFSNKKVEKKDIKRKIRQTTPSCHHRSSVKTLKSKRYQSESGRIFVISDLHLNHRNIIKYCHRPFSNVETMNKTIIQRWNKVVKPHDKVYFLGDLAHHGTDYYWKKKLNGRIIFIEGNHDRFIKNKIDHTTLHRRGYSFYFIHDPHKAPKDWNGWLIHGHVHNNQMKKYPLINGWKKSINVSCEVVNYTPVSLDWIINLGIDNIKRMETIKSKPIGW